MIEQESTKSVIETAVKPNIFALPNQTTILFGLIVTVLLGAMIIGSLGRSPIPVWPLTVGLLILSWRAFLRHPEIETAREKVLTDEDEFPLLQQTFVRLAEKIELSRTPALVIKPEDGMRTFGTFRRWYIVVGRNEAQYIQEALKDPNAALFAEAELIHELYHFKTGDNWQMNYARQLLRYTFLLLGWAILFFLGFGLLLVVAAPDILRLNPSELFTQIEGLSPEMQLMLAQIFPSASEMEEVRSRAAEVNLGLVLNFVLSAFLPFVLIGGIAWAFYWPKLWRLREVYADAGVVRTQGVIMPQLAALSSSVPIDNLKQYIRTIQQASEASLICSLKRAIKEWRYWLRHLRKEHYDTATRIDHIMNPIRVFGCWFDMAVLVGSLVLLLDILLASPLTLLYIGSWPMHFTTVVIFAVVSLGLIPELVLGRSGWSYMLKAIIAIVGLRLIWVLLTLGLLVTLFILAPAILDEMLAAAVAGVARYAGYSADLFFDDLGTFIVQASVLNLAQVFIIFLILVFFLAGVILLIRRLLTWYSFDETEERLMKVAYTIIGVGCFGLFFTVLPLVTAALLEPANLLNPVVAIMIVLGLVVTAVASLLFLYADRRYAGHCPQCHKPITGPFTLGKRCSSAECDELLHCWLIAGYEL